MEFDADWSDASNLSIIELDPDEWCYLESGVEWILDGASTRLLPEKDVLYP